MQHVTNYKQIDTMVITATRESQWKKKKRHNAWKTFIFYTFAKDPFEAHNIRLLQAATVFLHVLLTFFRKSFFFFVPLPRVPFLSFMLVPLLSNTLIRCARLKWAILYGHLLDAGEKESVKATGYFSSRKLKSFYCDTNDQHVASTDEEF